MLRVLHREVEELALHATRRGMERYLAGGFALFPGSDVPSFAQPFFDPFGALG